MEARLRQLEGKQLGGEAAKPRGLPGAEKYDAARQTGGGGGATLGQAKAYNADADVAMEDGEKKKKKKKVRRCAGGEEQDKRQQLRRGQHSATLLDHGPLGCDSPCGACCPPAEGGSGSGGASGGSGASGKRGGEEKEEEEAGGGGGACSGRGRRGGWGEEGALPALSAGPQCPPA